MSLVKQLGGYFTGCYLLYPSDSFLHGESGCGEREPTNLIYVALDR